MELGDVQQLTFACRVARFLGVILRNSSDLQRARVLVYNLLQKQCMGDNLLPLLENLAKTWPAVFKGRAPRRRGPLSRRVG